MSDREKLENALALQCRAAKLPPPERQYRFAPPRRWRFDFAWPDERLAVEVEGGIFIRGRHNRPIGMLNDMEKYNAALLLGWRVLRVAAKHVHSGEALTWIERALGMNNAANPPQVVEAVLEAVTGRKPSWKRANA